MSPTLLLLLAVGAVGHVVLWTTLVNRAHALGIARRWVNWLTLLCGIFMAAMPLVVAAVLIGVVPRAPAWLAVLASRAVWCYVGICALICIAAGIQRWRWSRHPERCGTLLANHTSVHECPCTESLTAPGIATWLSRLPGNEVLRISVQEKRIAIPRLLQDGPALRIVHLSDLHMSGRVKRAYFERVVDEVNKLMPDLVAITGDIIERDHCIDWIPATLGRLRAPAGVYYVFGNHDKYVDQGRLKSALADAGLVYLGGAVRQLTINNLTILVAGNELPWYEPAADMRSCPTHDPAGLPIRILLAHSPDQFRWAQANEIDLMLAGHLHGGQVRLPVLGAILAPAWSGVRYAAGVFTAGKTVMHVSRGTGSLTPVRYNCPPEIALLSLHPAATR